MNFESAPQEERGREGLSEEEILRQNLGVLVDLFRTDVESGVFKSEDERLRAGQIMAIVEELSEKDGEKFRLKDPHEFMLRMRVAKKLAEESSGDDSDVGRLYDRLDMPGLSFPKEWAAKRMRDERVEAFRGILEKDTAQG